MRTYLIREIDAKLLEPVLLKDLKSRNVEHADKCAPTAAPLEALVDPAHDPSKQPLIQRLGERVQLVAHLRLGPTLLDPFAACLDARSEERLGHAAKVELEKLADLLQRRERG